jgi:hypothetical protein
MPKLDRIPHFDPRSREYGVRGLLGEVARAKRVWRVRELPLDQGQEGACVGFAWAGELAATPTQYPVDDAYALALYHAARREDVAMGNEWPEGASVLGGVKALRTAKRVTKYHWAFGVHDVIDTIVKKGPVVLGINWYDGMYEVQDGLVEVSGSLAGGHAILANGYLPAHPVYGEVLVLTNSWGYNWGIAGSAFIQVEDVARLLAEDGEACVPTDARL